MAKTTSPPKATERDLFAGKRPPRYVPTPPYGEFNEQRLDWMAENKTDAAPTRISDSECPGLRIIIRKGGATSFHVQFRVRGKPVRHMVQIGGRPDMTLEKARQVTRTIIELGKLGIDVVDGLEKRLVRELLEQGAAWRA